MIEWWWLLPTFVLGYMIGIWAFALFGANKTRNQDHGPPDDWRD